MIMLLSTPVFALSSATPSKISQITLTSQANSPERKDAILFQLADVATLGNCPVAEGKVWFIVDGNDKTMVSYVMAAHMSGKSIRAHVVSDTDLLSGWCRVWTINWKE